MALFAPPFLLLQVVNALNAVPVVITAPLPVERETVFVLFRVLIRMSVFPDVLYENSL